LQKHYDNTYINFTNNDFTYTYLLINMTLHKCFFTVISKVISKKVMSPVLSVISIAITSKAVISKVVISIVVVST
jgi:hypothetical protein